MSILFNVNGDLLRGKTMEQLKIFENPDFGRVRVVENDGEPWFVGKDVAEILGYKDTSDAMKRHIDNEDKLTRCFTDSGQNREMYIINESGLYSLILSSRLPQAKAFKHWVTSDILPSIRKTGGYISGQEQMSPEELMAKALQVANSIIAERDKRISQLTAVNQIMQPKADYFDELVDRNLLTNFRQTAKELKVKEKVFVNFLIIKNYIYRDSKGKLMPRAGKSTDLFEVKETFNEKTQWSGVQTLITPKGRETFRLLLQGERNE